MAADPSIPRGACDRCLEGSPDLCPTVRHVGHGAADGAARELMAWPDRCLFPVPAGMTSAEAALLEPLAVASHALELGHVREGMTVGVLGCGPIGLCAVQAARTRGARRIVATERLPHRLAAARPGGKVVVAGIPADDRTSFPASASRRKGLTIRIARRLRGDLPARDRHGGRR